MVSINYLTYKMSEELSNMARLVSDFTLYWHFVCTLRVGVPVCVDTECVDTVCV